MADDELAALQVLARQEIGYDMCRGKLAEVLEKVLKGELIRNGWFLERTHDLERLRKELRTQDSKLADSIQPLCACLAEVYFSGRYPGFDLDDPDWENFRAMLEEVSRLAELVRRRIVSG